MAADHRGRDLHAGKRTYDENFGDVADHIDMSGFDFRKYYQHEQSILKPRLEEKGFTDIQFIPGETDSWGALSRGVRMTNKHGQRGTAWYG
jgi:hypothetical protein